MTRIENIQDGQSVPHEIQVTRRWLEEHIIGRGICPPLAKVAGEHRDGKAINWDSLAEEVEIVSLHAMQPNNPELLKAVVDEYYYFIEKGVADKKQPISKIFILPDFLDNADFSQFTQQLEADTVSKLAHMSDAVMSLLNPSVLETAQHDMIDPKRRVSKLLTKIFPFVSLFGQPLGKNDLLSDEERGPKERAHVIKRAPYYMVQLLQPQIKEDRTKLWAHNSQVAMRLGSTYEADMAARRRG